jgi:ABC-2 type transport system permease protein
MSTHSLETIAAGSLPAAGGPFARDRAPLPVGRVVRAYLTEARLETLAALRTPGFALPFLAVPVAIYLLFGVLIAGDAGDAGGEYGPGIANYLFAGFSVLAVVMPGIFMGVVLATEREGNLLKLKRALPLPPGATIVAKVLMAMGVAALAVTLVAVAALLAGKITLTLAQVAVIWAVLIVGTIPFCAIGLLLGALVSGSAAPAWGQLVFLPMMWLSGLFIPLPESLERWVILWPTFHLNQLALGLAGVEQFTFIPPAMAAAVLAGVTVLCGGLAIRRLARVG